MTFLDITFTKGASTGVGDAAVVMPATVEAGQVLIACVEYGYTVGLPTGWTFKGGSMGTSGQGGLLYYKVADGTEGGTTVNFPRRTGSNNKPYIHAVLRYSAFTFFDAGGDGAEDVSGGTGYTTYGGVFEGPDIGNFIMCAWRNMDITALVTSVVGGTPVMTQRGTTQSQSGVYLGTTYYVDFVAMDVLHVTGDYDPGLNFPPSADAAPWIQLDAAGSDYLVWGVVNFNKVVDAREPGPVSALVPRAKRVAELQLPHMVHTRMGV